MAGAEGDRGDVPLTDAAQRENEVDPTGRRVALVHAQQHAGIEQRGGFGSNSATSADFWRPDGG